MAKGPFCVECGRPATHQCIRLTGTEFFCTHHAEHERQLGKHYVLIEWRKLKHDEPAQPPKHPTSVEGYENKLKLLTRKVHGMSYDQVARFYELSAEELNRQAKGDNERDRRQLAKLLTEASDQAKALQRQFELIWKLCQPHTDED